MLFRSAGVIAPLNSGVAEPNGGLGTCSILLAFCGYWPRLCKFWIRELANGCSGIKIAPNEARAISNVGEMSATEIEKGGFHSARARGKPGLLPQLLPMPDAGSFVEDAVAELVGQHQNLAAMMRLVREHVSEHGPSGGPHLHPTAARELGNAAIWSGRESIRQHAQALRGAPFVRRGSLLHGASVGIEWRRTLQMRRGILQPPKTGVVQMREDGRDCPAIAFLTRRLRAPRTGIQIREDELVHCVVACVGFEQAVANLGKRRVRLECHESSGNLFTAAAGDPRIEDALLVGRHILKYDAHPKFCMHVQDASRRFKHLPILAKAHANRGVFGEGI